MNEYSTEYRLVIWSHPHVEAQRSIRSFMSGHKPCRKAYSVVEREDHGSG